MALPLSVPRALAAAARLAPTLPRLAPALSHLTPARLASSKLPRDSCSPTEPPPCPPCEPHPRPPCRSAGTDKRFAECVVCCPPPSGCRPPCAPALATCSKTCANVSPPHPPAPPVKLNDDCGAGRDAVALRLRQARHIRRDAYLRDVAARRRRPAPPPAPAAAPRHCPGEPAGRCVHATDGCQYTIKDPVASVCGKCGPCRESPPPKLVELMPDDACKVQKNRYIDPCAFYPKKVVTIDRSRSQDPAENCPQLAHSSAHSAKQPHPSKKEVSSSEHIRSRLMKSLNLSLPSNDSKSHKPCPSKPKSHHSTHHSTHNSTHSKHPKASHDDKGLLARAKRTGNMDWCKKLKTPPAGPKPCRPPGAAERLRRHRCRDVPSNPPRRHLHTGTTFFLPKKNIAQKSDAPDIVGKSKADAEKFEKMLKERAQLGPAARGRESTAGCGTRAPAPRPLAAGQLELPVPPHARNLRVDVSLGGPAPPLCPQPRPPTAHPSQASKHPSTKRAAENVVSCSATHSDEKSASWIQGLHKRIVNTCKKSDGSISKKVKKSDGGGCGTKTPVTPATPPRPPPCAPKPLDCKPRPNKHHHEKHHSKPHSKPHGDNKKCYSPIPILI